MKKNMKFKRVMSLLAVVTILFSLLTVTASAATNNFSDAKNSVVVVISEDGTKYGTGFAIGKPGEPVEYIVTNNHVVNGETNKIAVVAFDLASNEAVQASIFFSDAKKDLAVLKLPKPTELRQAMVLCPMEDVNPDDTFAALGYPGNQVTDWPRYNTDDITITKGGIKKADRLFDMDVYMLDLTITHGNSGGPLVNSEGEVVGINTFAVSGENYAIAIDELLRVIDDRIPVTLHGEINWIIIVGAAVLVAIIALVLVLVLVNKKKKDDDVVEVSVVDEGPVYGVPMPDPTPAPAPAPAGPSARLIAHGGTLNGKRFNVSGSIKIGRDSARCQLAFPVSTQGVSGVHCEVAFDGKVCYVKDLGSSYGTFTIDGQKLAANAPKILKSGDKFYLASPENTFEVSF